MNPRPKRELISFLRVPVCFFNSQKTWNKQNHFLLVDFISKPLHQHKWFHPTELMTTTFLSVSHNQLPCGLKLGSDCCVSSNKVCIFCIYFFPTFYVDWVYTHACKYLSISLSKPLHPHVLVRFFAEILNFCWILTYFLIIFCLFCDF